MFRRGSSLLGGGRMVMGQTAAAGRYIPLASSSSMRSPSSSSKLTTSASLMSTQYRFCGTNNTTTNGTTPVSVPPATPTTTSTPSPSSVGECANKEEESRKIAKLLEDDPKLLEEVIAKMSGEQRRRITVAGGAYEWFGKDKVSTELMAADADKDKIISPKDFNKWFDNALKRHTDSLLAKKEGAAATAAAAGATTTADDISSSTSTGAASKVTSTVAKSALFFIALETGLPFVGFGFLDNATMIFAGDAIDKSLGAVLHCSVMASAAMGNVISGMMGMQVHGFVEKMVHRLGLPTPILTPEQQRSQPVFLAGHVGGTVGIFIGLTLGMLPLLIIKADDNEKEHVTRELFDSLDANNSGTLSPKEVQAGLEAVGVEVPLKGIKAWMSKHSKDGKELTYEEFKLLHSIMSDEGSVMCGI